MCKLHVVSNAKITCITSDTQCSDWHAIDWSLTVFVCVLWSTDSDQLIILSLNHSRLSPVHTCHKMAPLNGTVKLPVWHRKMAPFFTGAILFPSNKLLVRHVTWSISSTSVGYCCACHEIYTATSSSSIIVENCIPNQIITVAVGTAVR